MCLEDEVFSLAIKMKWKDLSNLHIERSIAVAFLQGPERGAIRSWCVSIETLPCFHLCKHLCYLREILTSMKAADVNGQAFLKGSAGHLKSMRIRYLTSLRRRQRSFREGNCWQPVNLKVPASSMTFSLAAERSSGLSITLAWNQAVTTHFSILIFKGKNAFKQQSL